MTTQVQISTIASNSDFKVNMETGEAYISQRKTAEITGIPRSTLQDWIRANPAGYSTNESNQLDAKSLQKLVLSGRDKGYEKCADLSKYYPQRQ